MADYPLTPEQIAFFRANGFVQLDGMLTPEELAALRAAMDDVLTQQHDARVHTSSASAEYEKVFLQKVNLWRVHDGIRAHTLNPKIARVARQLAGDPVRLWHDHMLVKMPGDSKESPWHQDLPYWPMAPASHLSCWVAVDDVTPENGCMSFVPGSHRWGSFDPINLVHPQDLFAMARGIGKEAPQPVTVPLKAGSCTFHHGLTFHYAGPNRTDRPRRAMVSIFMPDGAAYDGKPHVVTDGQDFEVGKPLAGDLFPLLAE